MASYIIEAGQLMTLFFSGAAALEANKGWINDLNVFPVPDGDTGTNMTMTLSSAVKELHKLSSPDMQAAAKAISFGSLRGARGNSGVILSQLLRGFCKVAQDQTELNAANISAAMKKAVETAYKAVMKPKEGTILTVAKGMAEYWEEASQNETDLELLLKNTLERGDEVLAHTPELLPVLKEAGVVDSGGQGLIVFLKGVYSCLMGQEISAAPSEMRQDGSLEHEDVVVNNENLGEIKFGYCTEFLINLNRPLSENEERGFKAYLESLGDSIVMVADDEICKVHVHTNDPGLAIQKALTFGGLTNMKIDNMRFEHEEKLIRDASRIAAAAKADLRKAEEPAVPESEWKEVGFVATAVGEGLIEIFRSLGVDRMVEGGQTMNPSTEDMLDAIRMVPARTVFLLPNNKNIILAAEQAAVLTKNKKIVVIPTTTIPEGISCLLNYNPDQSCDENAEQMKLALGTVHSGEVTYSVRDTSIGGKNIHKGDLMGLGGPDGIYSVGTELQDVTVSMVDAMMSDDAGVISLYYGEEVSEEDAKKVSDELSRKYSDCDVELYFGGQPIYYYIVSVE